MRDQVIGIIRRAVAELNEELQYETLREVGEDTVLFGGDEGIDSISLVTLIVDLEREVRREFERRVTLADQRAMSMSRSPYRTVGSLADFIVERLGEVHA